MLADNSMLFSGWVESADTVAETGCTVRSQAGKFLLHMLASRAISKQIFSECNSCNRISGLPQMRTVCQLACGWHDSYLKLFGKLDLKLFVTLVVAGSLVDSLLFGGGLLHDLGRLSRHLVLPLLICPFEHHRNVDLPALDALVRRPRGPAVHPAAHDVVGHQALVRGVVEDVGGLCIETLSLLLVGTYAPPPVAHGVDEDVRVH
mmetsp:Transcript_104798/g.335730  ORF Transcript_104798/g.335730 Transcript_104798/m.335730 type:complete len:205 (+) Transcript_104798:30-644(+)